MMSANLPSPRVPIALPSPNTWAAFDRRGPDRVNRLQSRIDERSKLSSVLAVREHAAVGPEYESHACAVGHHDGFPERVGCRSWSPCERLKRRHQKDITVAQLGGRRAVEKGCVCEPTDARAACRSGAAQTDGMRDDHSLCARGLVDDCFQRLIGDFVGIGLREGCCRPSRYAHLRQISSGCDVLADTCAKTLRAAGNPDASELTDSVLRAGPQAGREYAGSFDSAGRDRIAKAKHDVGGRAQIDERREAGTKRRSGVVAGLSANLKVNVSVDQTGEYRRIPEVDHRPRRLRVERIRLDDPHDFLARHEDRRRSLSPARDRVEPTRGEDGEVGRT